MRPGPIKPGTWVRVKDHESVQSSLRGYLGTVESADKGSEEGYRIVIVTFKRPTCGSRAFFDMHLEELELKGT
jgi:hypothetical protein